MSDDVGVEVFKRLRDTITDLRGQLGPCECGCGRRVPRWGFRYYEQACHKRAADAALVVHKPSEHEAALERAIARQRRDYWLSNKYGLTAGDWDRMFEEQDRCCAACGSDEPGNGGARWHVDHCHQAGAVRGILCHSCNVALGHAKDDPGRLRALIDYLERS